MNLLKVIFEATKASQSHFQYVIHNEYQFIWQLLIDFCQALFDIVYKSTTLLVEYFTQVKLDNFFGI